MNDHLLGLLKDSADAINVSLDDRALDLFQIYYRELILWSEKMNLVSIHAPDEMIIKHFIDSLTPVPYIDAREGRLLDIGSGAGFPGIPLKIALPDLSLFLMEASRKKSSFLKHITRCLHLSQTTVLHTRVESITAANRYHRAFDTFISRAAFKLPQLIEMARYFLIAGGLLIAMKGPHLEDEEQAVLNAPATSCIACHDVRLPLRYGHRKILIFRLY